MSAASDLAGALAWARKHIVPSEARLLLRHVHRCQAAQLAAWPEEALPAVEWETFRRLVERREAGEPLAYLTGLREFYGRDFLVTPAVLIPRPETELLIDLALSRFSEEPRLKALDLGTGSGVLAITLALELDCAEITALDQSNEALEVAKSNAARLGANLAFLRSDWYAALGGERYQLIVANPPYIAEGDPHLAMGDLRFEPRAALAAGENGLASLAHIISGAGRHLEDGGWLLMEHGYDQSAAVRGLLADAAFTDIASWPDLAGIDRVSGGRWAGMPREEGAG
ncbi:MAG: peptide chain release factor N(5)-glutamine methyltransferase [Azoarcus sp.]|jgi:release factor glutamine methyltransferase|nr:peptide chain release factor N(5)-glutamine methyltransferase [Azoarcus sp.]